MKPSLLICCYFLAARLFAQPHQSIDIAEMVLESLGL